MSESNADYVPDLGVMGVHELEHIQPNQNQETCQQGLLSRSLKSSNISPFQICSISEKQICISFQSTFSDFQNFVQSDLYFISMYKGQGLFYHGLV